MEDVSNTNTVLSYFCGGLHFGSFHPAQFLRSNKASKQIYSPKGLADEEDASTDEVVPGSWRASELQMNPLPVPNSGQNASRLGKGVRDIFKEYFCNEGSVPWQWDRC